MNISIIIPTKNRPNFIERQLKYFSACKYTGYLLIGDSSESASYYKNKKIIEKYANNLNIFHYLDTAMSADQIASFLSNKITTKYLALLPDDDIILVPGLAKVVEFMDSNIEYSAAHGKCYELSVEHGKSAAFGKVTSISLCKMAKSEYNNPIERVSNFFSDGPCNVNMSIMRTNIAKNAFNEISKLDYYYSSFIFGEMTHAVVILAKGKIKEIDYPYLVRQNHDSQYFDSISLVEWFGGENWANSYIVLKNTLYSNLINNSDRNIDELKSSIDLILSKFIKSIASDFFKAEFIRKIKTINFFKLLFRYYREFKLYQKKERVDINSDVLNYTKIIRND
jgi:glycosyltransferase domain-containing protein